MAENTISIESEDEESSGDTQTRQRSTIGFPYNDYQAAFEVAKAIHSNVGHGKCSSNSQLAPWMNQSAKSSGFRTQIAAARLFGLIDSDGTDSYGLTELGIRIFDPTQEKIAKAEAFLRVPLFNALYEKYKGGVTPPTAALEREIVSLGVSEKQKARARQAFENSAEQTGFRDQGANRLVMPAVVVMPNLVAEPIAGGGGSGNGGDDEFKLDPLLVALIQKIPTKGEWPIEKRLRWFRTFAMNVSQVYDKDNESSEIVITQSGIS